MVMHIKTNNRPRPLKCLNDIPEKDRPEFDYLKDPDEARLVRIGTDWYDAMDTQAIRLESTRTTPIGWAMYVSPGSPYAKWNAVISESHWSGKLFRFVENDCVVTGTYHERDTPKTYDGDFTIEGDSLTPVPARLPNGENPTSLTLTIVQDPKQPLKIYRDGIEVSLPLVPPGTPHEKG